MKRRKHKGQGAKPRPKPAKKPSAEQVLCAHIPELEGERVLATSQGSGRFAAQFAVEHPNAQVACHFLDLYQAERAQDIHAAHVPNLSFHCTPELPEGPFDLVAFPLASGGEAELARDRMQQAHARLKQGGQLVVASENPRDVWLHEQMQTLFPKVTRLPRQHGMIYTARKTQPLKKVKDFHCEFAFRDAEQLIHLRTVPGVFSHRRLDGGARALINAMEIREGDRVCDMGCGSGAVGLAAALRAPNVSVVAVDSNPRALECTRWAVEHNGLSRFELVLDAWGKPLESASCDAFLGNPPYFSHYRIAEIFIRAATRVLKPDGRIWLVARQPAWFGERLALNFSDVRADETKSGYWVISAIK